MQGWKIAVATLGIVVGCAHAPRVRSILGPDGSPMLHVSCSADQGACFELAGRSCPNGYDLAPIFDAQDNNFLVRCRAQAVALSTAPSAPVPTATPAAAAPRDPGWPPPARSWSTADPWSTASGVPAPAPASASALPPTRHLPGGEIDIGY